MKTHIFKTAEMTPEYIRLAADAVGAGAVAVFPTDTVYGIGAGAFNEASIARIYQIKERPSGAALQILTGTAAQAQEVTAWTEDAQKLADAYWPGALTLILKPSAKGVPLLRGFAGLGMRVPGNNFLVELLSAMPCPLAGTSANLHGQPTLTTEEDILNAFDGKTDFIFLGGTLSPVASSVLDLTAEPKLVREAAVSRAELENTLGRTIL